jgi:hypothetical protein
MLREGYGKRWTEGGGLVDLNSSAFYRRASAESGCDNEVTRCTGWETALEDGRRRAPEMVLRSTPEMVLCFGLIDASLLLAPFLFRRVGDVSK